MPHLCLLLLLPRRETPLALAARRGCPSLVEALLQRGATVDRPGAQGMTPLMTAAFFGHLPVVQALLGRWVGLQRMLSYSCCFSLPGRGGGTGGRLLVRLLSFPYQPPTLCTLGGWPC